MFLINEIIVYPLTHRLTHKMYYKTMKTLVKTKVIRITQLQYDTLKKMQSYNVDVADFIRKAIKEKIKREYKDLIPKPKKEYCPF